MRCKKVDGISHKHFTETKSVYNFNMYFKDKCGNLFQTIHLNILTFSDVCVVAEWEESPHSNTTQNLLSFLFLSNGLGFSQAGFFLRQGCGFSCETNENNDVTSCYQFQHDF